jgi:hypothetical protein
MATFPILNIALNPEQQKRRPAETGPRFYFVLNKEREKEKRCMESALADEFMIPLSRAVLMNRL